MGVILGFLGMILFGLFVRLLGVEIATRHMPFCHWLVKFAAAKLPTEERAAAESEWLAVIEDLRSPTAQLLHSLSFAFSALRIRHAIDPKEARASAYARGILFGQASGMTAASGLIAGLLYTGDAQNRLYRLISSPTKIALICAVFFTLYYLGYRLLMWRFKRRERQQASSTPVD